MKPSSNYESRRKDNLFLSQRLSSYQLTSFFSKKKKNELKMYTKKNLTPITNKKKN